MARQLLEALRRDIADVLHDLVDQQLPQLGEVGAEEPDLVVVGQVVGAHPAHQLEHLLAAPDRRDGGHQRSWVALATDDAPVDGHAAAPGFLPGEAPEAGAFGQQPRRPMLEGELLMGAVGRLAQAHHVRFGHEVAHRFEVVDGSVRIGTWQRDSVPVDPRLDSSLRPRHHVRPRRRGHDAGRRRGGQAEEAPAGQLCVHLGLLLGRSPANVARNRLPMATALSWACS
jgi:hypothetical protein